MLLGKFVASVFACIIEEFWYDLRVFVDILVFVK